MQVIRRVLCRVLLVFLSIALTIAALPVAAQQTPTPAAEPFQGTTQGQSFASRLPEVVTAIDRYWAGVFSAAGLPYTSPSVLKFDRPGLTTCGRIDANSAAFYCTYDATIYLWLPFMEEKQATFGDYAPIMVLAHEWGHHIQLLTRAPHLPGPGSELQADCLAGVYTLDASQSPPA